MDRYLDVWHGPPGAARDGKRCRVVRLGDELVRIEFEDGFQIETSPSRIEAPCER